MPDVMDPAVHLGQFPATLCRCPLHNRFSQVEVAVKRVMEHAVSWFLEGAVPKYELQFLEGDEPTCFFLDITVSL